MMRGAGAALVLAVLCAPGSASAFDTLFTGGMGLTVWPMEQRVTAIDHSGVGLGISGRVMARLGGHLRLSTGIVQGEFEEADLSTVKQSLIFAGAEAAFDLPSDFYATVGARAGGMHLRIVETVEDLGADLRRVHDLDRWTLMVQPIAAIGVALKGKYHVELEGGAALDRLDGAVRASGTIVLAVYFRMGGTR